MNLERFRQHAENPSRTKDDLVNMMRNATDRGERECAAIARLVLDSRFPGWDKPRSRRGGSKPTIARFQTFSEHFPTTKDAFVWLVERFISVKPEIFSNPGQETIHVAVGHARNYFARSAEKLFKASPHLADDPNYYVRLSNGWFLNVNLSNPQKFDILARFARVAGLEYPENWNLEVEDPTEALKFKQLLEETIKELLG